MALQTGPSGEKTPKGNAAGRYLESTGTITPEENKEIFKSHFEQFGGELRNLQENVLTELNSKEYAISKTGAEVAQAPVSKTLLEAFSKAGVADPRAQMFFSLNYLKNAAENASSIKDINDIQLDDSIQIVKESDRWILKVTNAASEIVQQGYILPKDIAGWDSSGAKVEVSTTDISDGKEDPAPEEGTKKSVKLMQIPNAQDEIRYSGEVNAENIPNGEGIISYYKKASAIVDSNRLEVREGNFINGEIEGKASVWWRADVNSSYSFGIAEFKNGVREGASVDTYISGNKFEGNYQNGARTLGVYSYKNGDIYYGQVNEAGQKEGLGIHISGGTERKGIWAAGELTEKTFEESNLTEVKAAAIEAQKAAQDFANISAPQAAAEVNPNSLEGIGAEINTLIEGKDLTLTEDFKTLATKRLEFTRGTGGTISVNDGYFSDTQVGQFNTEKYKSDTAGHMAMSKIIDLMNGYVAKMPK